MEFALVDLHLFCGRNILFVGRISLLREDLFCPVKVVVADEQIDVRRISVRRIVIEHFRQKDALQRDGSETVVREDPVKPDKLSSLLHRVKTVPVGRYIHGLYGFVFACLRKMILQVSCKQAVNLMNICDSDSLIQIKAGFKNILRLLQILLRHRKNRT